MTNKKPTHSRIVVGAKGTSAVGVGSIHLPTIGDVRMMDRTIFERATTAAGKALRRIEHEARDRADRRRG